MRGSIGSEICSFEVDGLLQAAFANLGGDGGSWIDLRHDERLFGARLADRAIGRRAGSGRRSPGGGSGGEALQSGRKRWRSVVAVGIAAFEHGRNDAVGWHA